MAMVLNNLFPVMALIALGVWLKRRGMTSDGFLRTADQLVYYIFFPALLFLKIGNGPTTGLDSNVYTAALASLAIVFTASLVAIPLFRISRFQAGSFSQSCYRFNTYIGMAIAITALDEAGGRLFGLLVAVVIPVINVAAVTTLIWFSDMDVAAGRRLRMITKALVANPLILACLAGIAYSHWAGPMPVAVVNTLRLSASMTLPLALLSIGGALTPDSVKGNGGLSLLAAGFKLVVMPLIGYSALKWTGVTGPSFQVAMVFFALPSATSTYVLSSQLNSDTALASAAIVVTTVLSFIPLTLVLTVFF